MLNPVEHVFVGNFPSDLTTTYAALPVGSMQLFQMDRVSPVTVTSNVTQDPFLVGQKIATGKFRWSKPISSENIKAAYASSTGVKGTKIKMTTAYEAPTPCQWTMKLGGLAWARNMSLILEITFKNVRDLSPQFYNTNIIWTNSNSGSTAPTSDALIAFFIKNVERNPLLDRVLKAEQGTAANVDKLILTAKNPEYKLTQRHEWAPIQFECGLSISTPAAPMFANRQAVPTANQPSMTAGSGSWGSGYFAVVSDHEKRSLAYQGLLNWTHFPVELPTLWTSVSGQYTHICVPYAQSYTSADNTIGRRTNEVLHIYGHGTDCFSAAFNALVNQAASNIVVTGSRSLEDAPTVEKTKKQATTA